jgi:hypothetical protein
VGPQNLFFVTGSGSVGAVAVGLVGRARAGRDLVFN